MAGALRSGARISGVEYRHPPDLRPPAAQSQARGAEETDGARSVGSVGAAGRTAPAIALYYPYHSEPVILFPMSTTPAIGMDRQPQAALAGRCLYYMSMMREIEDRIERKLYRQGKIVGGVDRSEERRGGK